MTRVAVDRAANGREAGALSAREARRGPPLPGAWPHIAGYKLRRRVGQGRMSTAYQAQDLRRGGDVVLKVLDTHTSGGLARNASLAREFAVLSAVQSDHVIRVFDQHAGSEHSYLAMEYVAGGGLADRIRDSLTTEQAVLLLRHAAMALAELHQRGFVHCDVKPANLLLRAGGDLVLADFGLARCVGETREAQAGTVFGTPCYAAPEQTQGDEALPAADVYSLGVVFYEMLMGTPPFAGPGVMELQCQHLMAAVPRLPAELAHFQPLIDSMLEKDPQRRLPDGAAVLRQIDGIAPGSAEHARKQVPM